MIFTPLNEITGVKDAVFLAGPCPRANQDWEDWRSLLIDKITKKGFKGDFINPTNPNYDTEDPDYYDKQCTWETIGLHVASCIVFWIDRNDEHPALTTNIEFGIWSNKAPKALVVGIPEGSEHCGYIKWVCEKKGIACFDTMDKVADEVVRRFSMERRMFATSDTHFGSDRHLELSKRPFKDVFDMDLSLVSNFNKTVTSNDLVLHLGDFGDFGTLGKLNFGKMFLLRGNYEREKVLDISDARVEIMNGGYMTCDIDGDVIPCIHEPLFEHDSDIGKYTHRRNPDFYLFGHIHEKGHVKRNGFNVGVDANNYAPVDVETIRFYKNAIFVHYDGNVFSEYVDFVNN